VSIKSEQGQNISLQIAANAMLHPNKKKADQAEFIHMRVKAGS
jgi:hypothetical protein